jgi:hypothetical protein
LNPEILNPGEAYQDIAKKIARFLSLVCPILNQEKNKMKGEV